MSKNIQRLLPAVTALVLFVQPVLFMPVVALPSDADQSTKITSQKQWTDRPKGITVYSGDVRLEQGSLLIQADELKFEGVYINAEKITLTGNPASVEQQPDVDSPIVRMKGKLLEYFPDSEIITIQTNAVLERDDGHRICADRIEYDMTTGNSLAQGGGGDGCARVEVIIPAKKKSAPASPVSSDDNSATQD